MSLNKKTLLNREKKANPPPKGPWKSHLACNPDSIYKMARLRQSNQTIAKYMGICVDTLTNNFSELLAKARIDGDMEILEAQMDHAIKGSAPLLIHLGKCRLRQKDAEPTGSMRDNFRSLVQQWTESPSKDDAKDPIE